MFLEYDDCFQWRCDKCDLTAEFPRSDFWACIAELKARRWSFTRYDDGGWGHTCGQCRRSTAEILEGKFHRGWREMKKSEVK